jgi:hypothetical protein
MWQHRRKLGSTHTPWLATVGRADVTPNVSSRDVVQLSRRGARYQTLAWWWVGYQRLRSRALEAGRGAKGCRGQHKYIPT